MNAMCNTKQNDVRDCIRAMKEHGHKGSLTQTSITKYNALDNNKGDAGAFAGKHEGEYVIDIDKERIHKNTCKRKGTNTIVARLINIPATGLKVCGYCMK